MVTNLELAQERVQRRKELLVEIGRKLEVVNALKWTIKADGLCTDESTLNFLAALEQYGSPGLFRGILVVAGTKNEITDEGSVIVGTAQPPDRICAWLRESLPLAVRLLESDEAISDLEDLARRKGLNVVRDRANCDPVLYGKFLVTIIGSSTCIDWGGVELRASGKFEKTMTTALYGFRSAHEVIEITPTGEVIVNVRASPEDIRKFLHAAAR